MVSTIAATALSALQAIKPNAREVVIVMGKWWRCLTFGTFKARRKEKISSFFRYCPGHRLVTRFPKSATSGKSWWQTLNDLKMWKPVHITLRELP